MSNDKSIRVDSEAADIVAKLAAEREVTKVNAGSALVRAGYQALTAPAEEVGLMRARFDALLSCEYTDKNGNQYSVEAYAAEHGIAPYDAACKLVRIALGREGALARDRAKRPPKAPRAPKPAPEPVLAPWDLPTDGRGPTMPDGGPATPKIVAGT